MLGMDTHSPAIGAVLLQELDPSAQDRVTAGSQRRCEP